MLRQLLYHSTVQYTLMYVTPSYYSMYVSQQPPDIVYVTTTIICVTKAAMKYYMYQKF